MPKCLASWDMFGNTETITVCRSPISFRRFLIMIRCGSGRRPSLFNEALSSDRNFDVAVNYYAPPHEEDYFFQNGEFVIAGGLSKYHAAKQLMHGGFLHTYEGVYFLDEDLELHFDPSEFFEYCTSKGFAIAQASLSHGSDGAWRLTYHHPGFEYRLTNFVEVMAPFFARDFLLTVAEAFDISISTYGLDVFWGSQLEQGQSAAIVDRFQMSHHKARDFEEGAYYAYLKSIGVDCFAEMKNVLNQLGLASYDLRLLGGVEIVETVRVTAR